MLGGRKAHARLMCGAAMLALVAMTGTANAAEGGYDIAPQPLALALKEFGMKTGQPVLFGPALAATKLSPGVTGAPNAEAALTAMLAGTGLDYRKEGETFLIVRQGEGGSPQGESAAGGGAEVEALVVTAQKKEEAIQDVPIAISAFTQKSLDAQKIEGGFDLLKAIPNVTFSKNNFTGYNFSIRGIGTKAVSATTDPGVAVAFNNSGLIVNRLFEQEYFDVERVEVLRGPQGTLYGRNATSGVINVISAKPRQGEFEAEVKAEVGNYAAKRVKGMVNVPITDSLAVRAAGAWTQRSGYGLNLTDGSDVDGRDLWSSRLTVAFEPSEALRVSALWEHFSEDDNRVRTSKQLCHRDPGLKQVDGVPVPANRVYQFSQSCLPGSLYADEAFGTPFGFSQPYVSPLFAYLAVDIQAGDDVYANKTQSRNLREIESIVEPHYRAKADVFDLSIDFDLTDSLTVSSQTLYNQDEVYSTQDLNRFHTSPIFFDTTADPEAIAQIRGVPRFQDYFNPLFANGEFCDPQLGCSDSLVGQDLSRSESTQFNQEFRVQSNFDSSLNFSLGANYTYFQTMNDYFVFINLLTLNALIQPVFNGPGAGERCFYSQNLCVYVDPNPLDSIDGDGHNYFRSKNPYRLTSSAVFGELYWNITPTLTLTAGARMTWDRKDFTPVPSQTLLYDYRQTGQVPPGGPPEACTNTGELVCVFAGTAPGGRGYVAEPDIVQKWAEPTGRLVLDWKPVLPFTDETMVFASVAHGYKGGGANPPGVANPQGMFNQAGRLAVASTTFEPEFIDAFEVGTKNTLLGGALILNAGAFYYDYEGYQVSKIVDRTSVNENFDAKIWGLEMEWIFSPSRNLRFNGTFGHLNTEIGDGEESIDLMDRAAGGNTPFTTPDGRTFERWVIIRPFLSQTSNCLVPAEYLASFLAQNTFGGYATSFCAAGDNNGNTYQGKPYEPFPGLILPGPGVPGQPAGTFFNPATDAPNGGAGFSVPLGGNDLPNAPHWTASLGAQYRFSLPAGWDATLRGDFYWQSQSYARVYNTQYDKLRAWTNANISFWVENPEWGVTAEVYVKNVLDETPITDAFLFSDDTGLVTNVFTSDPRLIGVSLRKSF